MIPSTNISSFACDLKVMGLSAATTLQEGNIYAIAEEDDRLTSILLWGTLLQACEEGNSACLVSLSNIDSVLRSACVEEQASAFLNNRKLRVFDIEAVSKKRSSKASAKRLVADLEHWNAGQGRLVVVDGAEQLFSEVTIDLLRYLRDWTEGSKNILLLIFRQSGHNDNAVFEELTKYAQTFAGIVRLKSRYGQASWEVFHWFGSHGLISGRTFPIRCGEGGVLEVYEEPAGSAQSAEPAADESQIIVAKSVFLPKETAPVDWRVIEDRLEGIPALVSGAIAATVVLSFTQTTNFNHIARCVFDLRKQCGPRLKIVIREVNSRLRYSQETMSIRLGANLIVPAEISYARFLSLTSMVQGQIFPHNLPATYEKALADAMPEQEQGYLAPQDFARSVQTLLERSRVLNVQNAMLRLPLAYGLRPLDALRYCTIRRAGDLCSSDQANVYVFLYACREMDIEKTLDRLFGLPVSELFSHEERYVTARAIEEGVREFEDRRAVGNFPDLTEELAAVTENARPGQTAIAVAAVDKREQQGPETVRYSAPPPAVRRPLVMRGSPTLTDVSVLSP